MPIRSSHGYTRCPDCRRHVLAPGTPSDLVCPFCGGRGRATSVARSAILAGALALAGCGASEAESAEQPVVETEPESPAPAVEDPSYEPAEDPTMVEAYGMPPSEEEPEEPEPSGEQE